jgi:hypothetical protein
MLQQLQLKPQTSPPTKLNYAFIGMMLKHEAIRSIPNKTIWRLDKNFKQDPYMTKMQMRKACPNK